MQMNIHDAKTNLSKLVEAAEAGEEVIIARNNKPAVRLVAIPRTKKFEFGTLAHLVKGSVPEFLASLADDITMTQSNAD
jgi:prevent-host-death family protein